MPSRSPLRSDPRLAVGPVVLPYLEGQAAVRAAAELIDRFGDDAGFEAAARADHSRNLGNAIGFCRWRQIERLIVLLATTSSFGTVH